MCESGNGTPGSAATGMIERLSSSTGIVAAIMFFYNIGVKMFPVFEKADSTG
jgi:hypothetical protein